MKHKFTLAALLISGLLRAQTTPTDSTRHLYIDVHHLPTGKVNYNDVMAAHAKDLAVQGKYGTQFQKFWVDESRGIIYCLSSAPDSNAVKHTHRDAHGLMPDQLFEVAAGTEDKARGNKPFFLDVHQFAPNTVKAADVAKAHEKDLAVQQKHGVRFLNYWVDEQQGTVLCLSQAADAGAVTETHREAHGLLPIAVLPVKQGQ